MVGRTISHDPARAWQGAVDALGRPLKITDTLSKLPFPNNIIPAARIDPQSSKLLSIFPLPNATNTAVTNFAYNYQIAGYQKLPVKNETLRVDYNRSEKARLWFKAVGYGSENTGRTSPAINNQWGLADVKITIRASSQAVSNSESQLPAR